MFILDQKTYDESHHIWGFWTIYSPLFIKLIHGYTSSTLCNINFLFSPNPICNAFCKENQNKIILWKTGGKKNLILNTVYHVYITTRKNI